MDKTYLWLVFLIVAVNIGWLWRTRTVQWSPPKNKSTLRVIAGSETNVGKLAAGPEQRLRRRHEYFEPGAVFLLTPDEICIPIELKKPHTQQQGLGKSSTLPAIQGESNVLKCNFRQKQQATSVAAKKGSTND